MHWLEYSNDKLAEPLRNGNQLAEINAHVPTTIKSIGCYASPLWKGSVRRPLHEQAHHDFQDDVASDEIKNPSPNYKRLVKFNEGKDSLDDDVISSSGTVTREIMGLHNFEDYGWCVKKYSHQSNTQLHELSWQKRHQQRKWKSMKTNHSHITHHPTRIPSKFEHGQTIESSTSRILLGVRLPFSSVDGATTTTRPPPFAGRPQGCQTDGRTNMFDQTECIKKGSPACNSTDKSDKAALQESIHIPDSISHQAGLRTGPILPVQRPPSSANTKEATVSIAPRSPRRPKVAFIVPPEPEMDQISNKNDATGSNVLPGAATVRCELTEMSVANDPKTSPSVRFPGWGVITDDEEEDDKKPQPTLAENKCSQLTDKHVIENIRQLTEEKKLDEDSNNEKVNMTSNIKPINVKFEEPGMKTTKVPTTDLDKQRFRDQQEYFRRRESATISLAKSAAILRQPRKSLAMIFSNLSTNLGFTNSSVRSKTGSLGSTSSSDSTHPQPTTSNLPQKTDGSFIDLSGSKLIRDKRGHSTIIQLGRDQSVDHAMSYMNGGIGRRGRVSLLNTVLPTHGRSGTDAITPALTRDHSRNHLSPDTTTDRSLFVDLLCCTCCTQVDEEADYSTLIENHRLARFITMAAILTILGLILAYIIRSAIEAPAQTIQVGTQTSTPTSPITNGNQARVPFVELSSWTQSSSSNSTASRVVISTSSSIHVNITSTTPPYI